MTAAEIAHEAGISPSTITNWTVRDRPLRCEPAQDGNKRFHPSVLLAFCKENPRLPAAKKVRRALEHRHDNTHATRQADDVDIEALKSLARNMRAAAASTMEALLVAARQAEDVARGHREQLERIAETLAAYDDALTGITAPSVLND